MLRNRWIWAVIIVVMGALQGWDSGVLRAPAVIQALVALAIASEVDEVTLARSREAAARRSARLLMVYLPVVPTKEPTLGRRRPGSRCRFEN